MASADDAARFAAAKRTSTYRDAIEAGPPRRAPIGHLIVMLAVVAALFGGLTVVLIAAKMTVLAIIPAAAWLVLVVTLLRERRAKKTIVLAIVGGEGAQARGDAYGGPSGMSHFLILRMEDGSERTLSASPMAAAGLSKGDLGVAILSGNYVAAFTQITPPADAT